MREAATGAIQSIAHQGDPAPGGESYRLAFGAVVNNRGDIVFIGDLTPPPDTGDVTADIAPDALSEPAVGLSLELTDVNGAPLGTMSPGGIEKTKRPIATPIDVSSETRRHLAGDCRNRFEY